MNREKWEKMKTQTDEKTGVKTQSKSSNPADDRSNAQCIPIQLWEQLLMAGMCRTGLRWEAMSALALATGTAEAEEIEKSV